jgi:hypothetical protein
MAADFFDSFGAWDHQRLDDALLQRAAEFFPFHRPILPGIEKLHESGPGEQLEDHGHKIVSESANR